LASLQADIQEAIEAPHRINNLSWNHGGGGNEGSNYDVTTPAAREALARRIPAFFAAQRPLSVR
jgi:hypothetical protein